MKRAGLQSNSLRLIALVLILGTLPFISPNQASAVPFGSAPCVQNVSSTSGVAVYRGGNTCFVAFKSVQSYTWTPPTGVTKIDILVVAGGGGGGSRHSGGGGAGGLINSSNVSITSSDLTITVGGGGAGGAAASTGGNSASNGSNSVISGSGFSTLTAIGGGGGGYGAGTNSGGSGAGGGSSGAGGSGTVGQGNNGSAGGTNGSTYWVGGGGGGAGAAAGASTTTRGGNGGAGAEITWLTSTIVSNIGVGVLSGGKYYLAGGGGGGTDRDSFTGGDAGVGGGGAGSTGTGAVFNGTANTGGGGGGSGISGVGTGSFKGGDGGSGVVVIRYLIPTFTSASTASFAENTSISSNAATITVSESSTMTLVATADYALFTILASDSVTARIRFLASPDFESPTDVGGNNEYDITIRATNSSGNYMDSTLKITVTDVLESGVLSAPTLSAAPQKGRAVTIAITSDVPGKIRFFVTGKKIPNCLAQSTSGTYPSFTATCQWKPANMGYQSLRGTLTPTNLSIGQSNSPQATFLVTRRSNNR